MSDERDCSEGCDGDHKHLWEIEPNPYSSDFDVYVSDDDREALDALKSLAEMLFDDCDTGEERVIKIRRNELSTEVKS